MSDRHVDEQELEERLRAWLHAEATSGETALASLRDRVNAIPAVTPERGRAWRRLRSLIPTPAIAATVVIAIVLTAIGLGMVQQFVATAPDETANPAETATMEELDQAVTSAIEVLVQSEGVEGVQLGYIDEYLSGAVWFDSRPNGDVAVVQRVDVDVAQSAWWLNPTEGPPATGRNITTTVRVLVGDAFYEATLTNGQPDDGWSVSDRDAAPRGPLAFGLGLLTEEDYRFGLPTDDGEVTHAESPAGGRIWTLTAPYQDGNAVQRWHIRSGGELGSWSSELVGVSMPLGLDTDPTTSARIEFTPLSDPDPINAPNVEADPDLGELDLPEDLPLGSG